MVADGLSWLVFGALAGIGFVSGGCIAIAILFGMLKLEERDWDGNGA